MKLFNIGDVEWKTSQLVYHALAHDGVEGIVLSSPRERYVSVGFPQDPREELDLGYCKREKIGVFRRETGGGTVLLDKNQLFYNIIVRRDREDVPKSPEKFFRKYLTPVVLALEDMRIKAAYRPLCDLVVNNKKISGNGGGEIGDCMVIGGGLLLDFDKDTMSRCLKASPEMRQRFKRAMDTNITTVKEQLGYIPARFEMYSAIETRFEELFGKLEPAPIPEGIYSTMEELDKKYFSDEWFLKRGITGLGREIKVREGTLLLEKRYDMGARTFFINLDIIDGKVRSYELKGNAPRSLYKDLRIVVGSEYDRRKILAMLEDKVGKARM